MSGASCGVLRSRAGFIRVILRTCAPKRKRISRKQNSTIRRRLKRSDALLRTRDTFIRDTWPELFLPSWKSRSGALSCVQITLEWAGFGHSERGCVGDAAWGSAGR